MRPISQAALPVLGMLVFSGPPPWTSAARAQPSPPPLIVAEIHHAQNDFATGGIRRLSATWFACTDQARASQDANIAERCVVYGYSALLLGDAGATATPWMRHLTFDIIAPGQYEMAGIMGIPEGPRQAWLDRYQRWVAESVAGETNGADNTIADADDAPSDGGVPVGPGRRGTGPYRGPSERDGSPYDGGRNANAGYDGSRHGGSLYGGGGGSDLYGSPQHAGSVYGGRNGDAASDGSPYGGSRYGGRTGDDPYNAARDGAAYQPADAGGRNGDSADGTPPVGGGPRGRAPLGGGAAPVVAYGLPPTDATAHGGGHGNPELNLARLADGKYPREALQLPAIADALRQLVGPALFTHLKAYSFASPLQFTGRYTTGMACEPRACGVSEARFVLASDAVWVGIIKSGVMRIYGAPPRQVRALLLRDREQTIWHGIVADMTRPVPPHLITASVDATSAPVGLSPPRSLPVPGGPPRLSIAPHPFLDPPSTEPAAGPVPGGPPRLSIAPHPFLDPPVSAQTIPGGAPQMPLAPHPVLGAPGAEAAAQPEAAVTEVRMRNRDGTFEVPVTINDAITLPFAIDSGSSDVSISANVLQRLIQAGTVSGADMRGRRTYHLADGSVVSNETFMIHVLKVGDREIHNVMGSVTNDANCLLLGQSFLDRFRSWSIDNQRQVLVLKWHSVQPSLAENVIGR